MSLLVETNEETIQLTMDTLNSLQVLPLTVAEVI